MRITMLMPVLNNFRHNAETASGLKQQLSDALQLGEEQLRNPNLRLPIDQVDRLLAAAKQISKQPELGLVAGQKFELKNYGLLGFMLSYCDTFAEVADLSTCYYRYLSSDKAPIIEQRDGCVIARHKVSAGQAEEERTRAELFVSAILQSARILCSQAIPLQSLKFQFPEPEYSELYNHYFPETNISFNHSHTELIFDESCLDVRLDFPDQAMKAAIRQQLDDVIHKEQASGYIQQVSNILTQQDQGFAFNLTLNEVASLLNISGKTLSRRLQQEGSSFKQLHEQVRHQFAVKLLRNRQNKIDHIALELGYADRSSFDRSFSRREGVSPAAFRTGLNTD
ncbi:AraC family transcriptional regulator ligand-binding domain-containing protein [Bacterioplanoides sp.]|uniref:AraC family transcriptional regulator n=1 Tax=Bacterioplanoides sp. TaxID=2066072 RepID=UPI003B59982C